MTSLAGTRIAVTGANGFIGRALCRSFTAQGATVHALVREPEKCRDLEPIAIGGVTRYVIGEPISSAILDAGFDVMIHCACSTTKFPSVASESPDIVAARELHTACVKAGVSQFLFISSLAAHSGAQSGYGKSKWAIERALEGTGATIIKPGTVIGSGGLFRRIADVARESRVLPVIYPNNALQTVWIDDLCQAIGAAVEKRITGTVIVAAQEGVTMLTLYKSVIDLVGSHAKIVPVSGDLLLAVLRLTAVLSIGLPVTIDNVLGLKHVTSFDTGESNQKIGFIPRNFAESLLAVRPDFQSKHGQ